MLTLAASAHARARVRAATVGGHRAGGDDSRARAGAPLPARRCADQRIARTRNRTFLQLNVRTLNAMDLAACRYVVVEGPIGAGKTSLARELAQRLHADDAARAARGQSVPRALLRRHGALSRCPPSSRSCSSASTSCAALAQLDMFRRPTDRGFPARQGSAVRAAQPLRRRIRALREGVRAPEAADADARPRRSTCRRPVDTLVERVHRRGVDYERTIPADYLARLADAYTPLLLPLRGRAAPDRQQRAAQFRRRSRATSTCCCARIADDARPTRVLQPWRLLTTRPARSRRPFQSRRRREAAGPCRPLRFEAPGLRRSRGAPGARDRSRAAGDGARGPGASRC